MKILFQRNIAIKATASLLLLVWFNIFGLVCQAGAQAIAGKVVGVAYGDTITVLQDHTQYKIRFYGIDTPERGQDLGNRAKQFTSNMVFGQQVKVIQKDINRYDRIVGMVFVGNTCVNQEIVKAGMAWVYDYYCKDRVCPDWKQNEKQAQEARISLWSHPDPVPPWGLPAR